MLTQDYLLPTLDRKLLTDYLGLRLCINCLNAGVLVGQID